MENILIVFEADTNGINVGIDALEKLGKVDKETAVQFSKTNSELKDRNKLLGNTGTVSAFVDGMKKVQAASTGAFGTKAVKDFQNAGIAGISALRAEIEKLEKQQKLLNNTSGRAINANDQKTYQQALEQTSQQLKELQAELVVLENLNNPMAPLVAGEKQAEAETRKLAASIEDLRAKISVKQDLLIRETDIAKIATLKKEIIDLEGEMVKANNIGKEGFDEYGNKITGLGSKFDDFYGELQPLTSRLGELEDRLYELAAAGKANTAEFKEIQAEAIRMRKTIIEVDDAVDMAASRTAGFDSLIQTATAATGAFQAVEGAAALFGGESEELQKTLVKLNAIMAITQGLQQIQDFLRGNSIVKLRLEAVANGVLAASNTALIATYTALGISVNTSSTAFKLLRGAMLATGIGVVIFLVGQLVSYFREASDNTLKFDGALKGMGTTATEIAGNAISALDEEIKSLNENLGNKLPAAAEKGRAALKLLHDEAAKISKDKGFFSFDLSAAGIKNSFVDIAAAFGFMEDRMTTNAKQQAQLREKVVEAERLHRIQSFRDQLTEAIAITSEGAKVAAETAIQQNAAILSSDKSSMTQRTAALRSNLAQQRAIIQQDLDKSLSETADPRRRALAQQQANLALLRAEQEFNNQMGALQKDNASQGRDIAERNSAAIFEINQRHLQQEVDAYKAFSENTAFGNTSRLFFLQQYIDKETQLLEAQRANAKRVRGLTAAEVQNIDDQYNTQLEKLTSEGLTQRNAIIKQKNTEALNSEIAFLQEQTAREQTVIDRMVASVEKIYKSAQAGTDRRFVSNLQELNKAYEEGAITLQQYSDLTKKANSNRDSETLTNEIKGTKAILDNLKYQHEQRLISDKAYIDATVELNAKLTASEREEAEKRISIAQEEAERKAQIRDAAFQTSVTFVNGLFDLQRKQSDAELQRTEDLYAKKLITEREHDKRVRQIKRRQAVVEREQALFNIAVSVAQAIARDLVGNKALIPFDIAMGIVQTGAVLAAPMPAFKKGKVGIEGPGSEESDSIVARISRGESVIQAKATRKYRPILEAINNMEFEQYMQKHQVEHSSTLPKPSIDVSKYVLPDIGLRVPDVRLVDLSDEWMRRARISSLAPIDYDKLANKMADAIVQKQGRLEDMPHSDVTFDEKGITTFLRRKNSETEYVNKYYSSRKGKS